MKRNILFGIIAVLLLCLAGPVQAQGIKDNIRQTNERKAREEAALKEQQKREAEWKKEQQRAEKERREAIEREQARIKKGQVSLTEQIQILKIQNLDEADVLLKSKGWSAQPVTGNNRNLSNALSWAFDKDNYSDAASAWCYLVVYNENYNRREFRYMYSNDDQYKAYEAELKKNGFGTVSSDILGSGIQNVWKDSTYMVTVIKSTGQYGDASSYRVCIYNYRRELNLRAQELKQKREQEAAEKAIYEERIAKARLSLEDLILLARMKNIDTLSRFLTEKGWKKQGTSDVKMEELVFSGKQFVYDLSEDLKLPVDYLKISIFDNFEYNSIIEYQTTAGIFSSAEISNSNFTVAQDSTTSNTDNNGIDTNTLKKTIYQSTLFELDVTKHLTAGTTNEDGYFTNYDNYFLFNTSQLEIRKEIRERQRKEDAVKQARRNELVAQAETPVSLKNYRKAKSIYEEALTTGKGVDELNDLIKKMDIEILIVEADSLVQERQYTPARIKILEAKKITPNHRTDSLNALLDKISQIEQFLVDRNTTRYDYQIVSPKAYQFYSDSILRVLKSTIAANTDLLTTTQLRLTCHLDTFGRTTSEYKVNLSDRRLNNSVERVFRNVRLAPYSNFGYLAMADANFNYNISYNHAIITVKKNQKGLSSKHSQFYNFRPLISSQIESYAPHAKYTYDIHKTEVNGQSDVDCKLTDMHIIGGPANAWLSLLIPGLGDHRVTYGQRKGVGTAILTYTFIGAGAGALLYDYYRGFNVNFDKRYITYGAYASIAVGGIIWITDIIWVAAKGAKNKKEYKLYKKSKLNAYYDPFTQTPGIAYSFNF